MRLARALIMSGDVDAGLAELVEARELADGGRAGCRPGLDGAHHDAHARRCSSATSSSAVASSIRADDADHADRLGDADRLVAIALHHLQARRARRRLGGHRTLIAEERGYVDAGRALVAAVAGDPVEALAHCDLVGTHANTYLDRAYAGIARALATVPDRATPSRPARRCPRRPPWSTPPTTASPRPSSASSMPRMAERGGRPDAVTARSVADQRLQAIGIDAEGWRRLVSDALDAVAVST